MVLPSRQQSDMSRICPIHIALEGCHMQGKWFIPVYRLGEDGDLKNEGGGMLLVWALRARSYKTKAEV